MGSQEKEKRAVTEHKPVDQQQNVLAVGLRIRSQKRWWESGWSSDPRGMSQAGLLKGCGLIRLLRFPNGVQDACPHIGQSTNGDGMALALSPLALVILLRPDLLVRRLPGKLLQGIAPGLDTAQPSVRFLVRPALKKDRRSP